MGFGQYEELVVGSIAATLRRSLFGLSPDEATFSRRGFHDTSGWRRHELEFAGRAFLQGYHYALENDELAILCSQLNEVDILVRGFAYEGAGMALELVGSFSPW